MADRGIGAQLGAVQGEIDRPHMTREREQATADDEDLDHRNGLDPLRPEQQRHEVPRREADTDGERQRHQHQNAVSVEERLAQQGDIMRDPRVARSEEPTSELKSLMSLSYAVF